MLNMLSYEEISNFWDLIRNAAEKSLPPIAQGNEEERMNKILEGLLNGVAQCWMSYDILDDGTRKFNGIMITTGTIDHFSGMRNLLLYCGYGYSKLTQETWTSGYQTVSRWAEANGFERLIAYSNVPDVIRAAKFVGGETEYTFISIPLCSNFKQTEEV